MWGYVYSSHQSVWTPGGIPIQIKLGTNTTLSDGTNHSSSVQAAMETWNGLLGTIQFMPQIVASGGQVDYVNDIYFDSTVEGQAFGSGVLAVTLVYTEPSVFEITEADIIFNTAWTWDSYRGSLQGHAPEDIRRVALHELGHVIGLSHPDQNGQTVTALMNSIVSDLDALAPDDIAGAQSLYRAPGQTSGPGNDNFANATTISLASGSTQTTGSSLYATKETGEPDHDPGSGVGGASVWWKWTAPANGSMTITTQGSKFDTLMGVYTGSAVTSLALVGNNDDAESGVSRYSSVSFTATSGVTYAIAVDGWDAASGPVTLNLNFTPAFVGTAPSITSQPGNQTVMTGQSAQFSVAASGNPTPTYQWQRLPAGSYLWNDLGNDGTYSGTTTSTLTVVTTLAMNGDMFRCVASNSAGSATSSGAGLTVTTNGPIITSLSPTRQVYTPGQSMVLGVSATGVNAITYQWIHNGRAIAGATNATFSVPSLLTSDSGWYVVLLTDSNGTKRSAPIFVSVSAALTQVRDWGSNGYGEFNIPAGLTNVLSIDSGDDYSLALKRDGTVVAWGLSSEGRTAVPVGLTGVVAVSAGSGHSLALKSDGTVVGWGRNYSGETNVPTGLTDVVAISAGDQHSLALKSDGTVVGWGYNYSGQATPPVGLTGVVAISAGNFFSLALKSDGTVVGWGYNNQGQATVPADLNNVVAISAGYFHSLGLKADGTVVAWGANDVGQSGVPADLISVVGIAAGYAHSVALKADGTVVAWGSNSSGQSTVPADLAQVFGIAAGRLSGLALRDATGETAPTITAQPVSQSLAQGQQATFTVVANGLGTLTYQWRKNGMNIAGATGPSYTIVALAYADAGSYDVVVTNYIGSITSATAVLTVNPPAVISSLSPTRQVLNPGQNLNLSVTATGVGPLTYQWTRNGRLISGATGSTYSVPGVTFDHAGWYLVYVTDNNGTTRSAPIFVSIKPDGTPIPPRQLRALYYYNNTAPALTDVVSIASGESHSLALRSDGSVYAWGANDQGQATVPAGLNDAIAVAAGGSGSLALRSEGTVVAWGGSSGIGPLTVPANLGDVVAVATSGAHSLALKSDGTVVAWGYNYYGQATVPVGLTDVVAISARNSYSLALRSNGTVVAWGELANTSATPPTNLTDVIAIAAGETHAMALRNDGTVVEWGFYYQNQFIPTKALPSNLTDVMAIATGSQTSFAVKSDGTVVGWGNLYDALSGSIVELDKVISISAGYSSYVALRDASSDAAPVVSIQPATQTLQETQTATFTAMVSGARPWTYQWRKDGVNISGATAAMLTKSNITFADAGNYDVMVTNYKGTGTSNAAILTVVAPLPTITMQPISQAVLVGAPVGFAVGLKSSVAESYQWQKDGVDIPGATSSEYGIASVTAGDVGTYTVVVTNSAGSVTSNAATLAIALPPVITTDPATQTVNQGSPVTFSVAVTSNAYLSYVWRRNGVPIDGATSASYTIASAQATDAADYSVVVTNVAGSATSNAATLVVQLPPAITQQPASQQKLPGAMATFTVAATSTTTLSYQWQRLPAGSGTWANVTDGANYSGGATTALTISNLALGNSGDQFRCVVTNVAGTATSNAATLTVTPAGFARISAGRYHSLRLSVTSRLYATGTNTYGQLGDGTTTNTAAPVPVAISNQTIAAMVAGAQHSLFLTSANELWASGYNGNGQLGDGTLVAKSTPFQLATNVAGMAAAVFHSAYLKTDGTLWTVGGNDSGQLGDGTTTDRSTPVQVATGVIDVALGNRQSFYLKSDGTLWGMGDMNGSGVPVSTPVQVAANVKAMAAGAYHSLILKTDGTLWTMGYNPYGQLGNGTTTDSPTPVQIATGVTAIAAGYFHSAFLKADHTLWMMGYNSGGQLGDGTTTNRPTPFQLASNVVSVSASEAYTLFTKEDGSLWGTGHNAYGQLGNGDTASTTVPVQISTGVVLAPATPAGLTASTVAALDRVHLTWQPAADAGSYEVWRSTTNDSSTATLLATGLRWGIVEDVTAANGQTYYYWIKAVNPAGTSAFSPSMAASTSGAPSITIQPISRTVNVGDNVTFTIVAGGTAPFTYQWRKAAVDLADGGSISGATTATLTITGAQAGDAGSYDVVVSNSAGSATSTPATLMVGAKTTPIITWAPPAAITYGTALSSTQFNASTNIAGTFVYAPASGMILPAGSHTLDVVFTPTDTANYNSATSQQTIMVNKAPVTINLTGLSATYDGAVHPVLASREVIVTTLAGASGGGSTDGPGSLARFASPWDVAVDSAGNIFVADQTNDTIRKMRPDGTVSTFAGSAGLEGSIDGTGNAARFNLPRGVTVDGSDNVYVADTFNHTIRKITPAGVVTTLAGSAGLAGSTDATGSAARFNNPSGVAADGAGNVYVADTNNSLIRKITAAGAVTTLAGLVGQQGSVDGTGSAARFSGPTDVAVDETGNVYVADQSNCTIRKITPAGEVTTVAGTPGIMGSTDGAAGSALFNYPWGVAIDASGNVYVADFANNTIRKITSTGVVTTLAGTAGTSGATDGTGSTALFSSPSGVAVDGAGNVYVADETNSRIRKISGVSGAIAVTYNGSSTAPTQVGNYTVIATLIDPNYQGSATGVLVVGKAAQTIDFSGPADRSFSATPIALSATASSGLPVTFSVVSGPATVSGNSLTLTGTGMVTVRASQDGDGTYAAASDVDRSFTVTADSTIATPYTFTTLAGVAGFEGSANGSGNQVRLFYPSGVTVDDGGTVYVGDTGNQVIRRISSAGVVSTLAGTVGSYGSGDGIGSGAQFYAPKGVAVDHAGNIYVADQNNQTIRKVTPAGVVTTLAGSAGNSGFADGQGGAARFANPEGVAVDSAGNVYVADYNNGAIRKIAADGTVTTLAGSLGNPGSADGVGAAAQFLGPSGLALDPSGNLYVTDSQNHTIRKIATDGVVTTVAGLAGVAGSTDGTGSAARFSTPSGIAVDGAGNIFVADFSNHTIRKITTGGVVTTIAGLTGGAGSTDGTGEAARFREPHGLAVDAAGNVYVADNFNHTIRWGAPSLPALTSAPAVSGGFGQVFNYILSFSGVMGGYRASGLPSGLGLDSATGMIAGTPTATGVFPVTVEATNGAGTSTTTVTISIEANYLSWQHSKFTAGERADANISGPNAVYGQDGLPNLVKYALGLEPKQNITTGLPAVSTTGSDWVYTYTRPSDRIDITYEVEVSTDLVNWTTAGVTHELVSSSFGSETWHARYPLVSAANVFFRLKVVQ